MKPSDFIFHQQTDLKHQVVYINPKTQITPLRDYYEDAEWKVIGELCNKFNLESPGSSTFYFIDENITAEVARELLLKEGLKENEEFSKFMNCHDKLDNEGLDWE
jgi:hypothetical protein